MFAIHIAGKPLIGPPQSLRSHFAFKDATHHTKEKYGLCLSVYLNFRMPPLSSLFTLLYAPYFNNIFNMKERVC